jgi:hypothetical protein
MRNILLAAALSLTAIAGCSKSEGNGAAAKKDVKVPNLTVEDVDHALAANEAVAVDCNGNNTRKRVGYVPGAILISDEEKYAANELPADKTKKLVFYCGGPD